MRGLWSMAAQLRACHCRTCLRGTTNTPARRVTTGATDNPRRRKVLASDVFTACYSAIMATAAVFDARRKDSRRRKLDNEIAEAKSSLASLLGESVAHDLAKVVTSPYPNVPYRRPLAKKDVLDDICLLDRSYLRDLFQKRKERLEVAQSWRTMLGLDWNPEFPDKRKSTLLRCNEVMEAEDEIRNHMGREPKTETHMGKLSDMITDLVDRLMAEAWWATEVQAPGTHPNINSPDSASTMIRMLRSDGYPSYSHPNLDPAETLRQRTQLNEFNLKILQDWAPPFRERLVAKICYNFLVCRVSPGIQNYNLLILGFSSLGEHNLSQAVVDSFLFLSHMKPTEATYLCLLQHYRLKGDLVGFQGAIRRMFGYDPRGIGLLRRTADHVEQDPKLRDWAATQDVAFVQGHYLQRAPLTQNVAEAMMEGLIDFGMLRECAKLLAVCLREKWTVSKDLLWRLFHSTLNLLDTAAAKMIIRGLLDNIDQASLMLLGPEPITPGQTRQLHYLLNIWQTTALPGELESDGGNRRFPLKKSTKEIRKAKLDHLATAIWIRETQHQSNVMCWHLNNTNQALFRDKDMPLGDRLDKALFTLKIAETRLTRKTEKAGSLKRIAKLDWLTTQTIISDYKIRGAEDLICQVLAKSRPKKTRAWAHFHAGIPIERRIKLALPYGIPGTLEHAAAECFRVSQEIDSQLKTALMEALPLSYARGLQQTQTDSGDVSLGRILAYVEHYLAGVKSWTAEEAKRARPAPFGKRAKRAQPDRSATMDRPDPFARLLEKIPKPSFSFWKSKSGSATAGDAPAPGHVGW